MKSKMSQSSKNSIMAILGGALLSISITLILILVFALFIRYFDISNNWIFPVNQVIKIISLFIGIIVALKKLKNKGLMNGILIAITYFILSYLIFSILQGKFSISLNNLYDFILTMLMGGLIGIIVVNITKK